MSKELADWELTVGEDYVLIKTDRKNTGRHIEEYGKPEKVKVLGCYPHHILFDNGRYRYSILKADLAYGILKVKTV